MANSYLNKTRRTTTAGRKTFTFSVWLKEVD